MGITFLEYPKCSTCKKAKKWLKENNIEFTERNIVEENPTKEELKEFHNKSGLPINKLFNTSGVMYRELNLKDKVKSASEDELLELLSSNGMLVKRPLLVLKDKVLIGFKEEQWAEILNR